MIPTGPSKILTLIILHLTKNNLLVLSGANRQMKMKVLTILLRLMRVMPLTGLHLLGVCLYRHPKKTKRVRNPKNKRRKKINGRKVSKMRNMKRVKKKRKGSATLMINLRLSTKQRVRKLNKLRVSTMIMKNSRTGLRHFKKKTPQRHKKKDFLILKNSLLSTNQPKKMR